MMLSMNEIVLDTNVLLSALRSNQGASFKLLQLVDHGLFSINLSVPLFSEYESVLTREKHDLDLTSVDDILNYLALIARKHEIFYLWRPFLKDPFDDHVLELAVKSNSRFIITFNKRDFAGTEKFGIELATPAEYLKYLGVI